MSNEESRKIPDTRGRPRSEAMEDISDQVEEAYRFDRLPVDIAVKGGDKARRKEAKKLRNARSFVELQKELGVKLRVLPTDYGFLVCLRRED